MRRLFLITTIAIVMFLFAGCSTKSQDNTFSSTVEMKTIDINSEIAGRIVKIYKDEGNFVKKGDAIAEIDNSFYKIQVDNARTALELANTAKNIAKLNLEIAKFKDQALQNKPDKWQINQLKENILQLKEIKKGNDDNIELVESKMGDMEKITNSPESLQNIVQLKVQLNSLKSQSNSLTHQINALNNQLIAAQSIVSSQEKSISKLSIELAEEGLRQAEDNVRLAQKNLEIALLNLEKTKIKSPIDGIILFRTVEEGQFISTGTIIAQIGNDEYYIKIYVPSKDLDKLTLGNQVNIITENGKKAKGKIVYISNMGEFTPRNIETKEEKQKVVYMVKIDVIENKSVLKPGMIVDVQAY